MSYYRVLVPLLLLKANNTAKYGERVGANVLTDTPDNLVRGKYIEEVEEEAELGANANQEADKAAADKAAADKAAADKAAADKAAADKAAADKAAAEEPLAPIIAEGDDVKEEVEQLPMVETEQPAKVADPLKGLKSKLGN